MLTPNLSTFAKLGILAATLSVVPIEDAPKPLAVYYEGATVQFAPEMATGHRAANLGPWIFGARLRDEKPLDKRLNLYVVVPGSQYRSAVNPEYDHNLIINALTHDKAREWDIFWCFVVDPEMKDDFRSEHDLLLAAQQTFTPADLFDAEDIPGHEVLKEKSDIEALGDLVRYRRKDGTLPRLLILPAHLAVSATAENPNSAPAPQ
ncbi:MAG TPA: hypothetical protein VJA94_13710 [Candidatus Angelobacter sp.]